MKPLLPSSWQEVSLNQVKVVGKFKCKKKIKKVKKRKLKLETKFYRM